MHIVGQQATQSASATVAFVDRHVSPWHDHDICGSGAAARGLRFVEVLVKYNMYMCRRQNEHSQCIDPDQESRREDDEGALEIHLLKFFLDG